MDIATASNIAERIIGNQKEILNVIWSVLIGVITGIISSELVTRKYRYKDREIENGRFIRDVLEYVNKLEEITRNTDPMIPDSYVYKVYHALENIGTPIKYKWIYLSLKENCIVNEVLKIGQEVRELSFEIQMKIGCMSRDDYPEEGKKQLGINIDNKKLELVAKKLKLIGSKAKLEKCLRKYIHEST